MIVTTRSPSITLVDRPNMRELMSLWRTMRADPTTFGTLMDTFPSHLEDWLLPCDEDTMYVWLIMVNGEVAGAHWIHDWGVWDCPDSAWTAGYLLPSFRGATGAAPLQLMRDYALDMGIKHLFNAIRTTNAASIGYVKKAGFKPIGAFPDWGWFEGQLDTVMLCSLRNDDHDILWHQATQRAQHHRLHPPPQA